MKLLLAKFLLIPLLMLGFTSYHTDSDDGKKEEVLQQMLLKSISDQHYTDRAINDDFSIDAYDLYIQRTDFNKRFLLQEDIDKLNKYSKEIDDQIQANQFELFELSASILEVRMDEARGYYQEVLAKPFDFNKSESFESDAEKLAFPASKKEMKERWRKYLKYQTLARLYNDKNRQEEAAEKSDTVTIKSFKELEVAARKKVLESHDSWFARLDKMDRDDRLSIYLNAITASYDPHTNYFPPKDKANFDISMSGRLEGIGAQLQEKDGYIKVIRIVPGSASWRQGELKAGDIILKVGQADEEPVDVVDMSIDDAVQLIRGKKGSEVRLTVRKIDGVEDIIPIIRDIVVLEETYAKSAVLESDINPDVKVGLIHLPKFYADFSKTGGRSSAADVKQEVLKLKEAGVDGLVLDLRNNGGGSLQDVVDMMGLFIEQGPVVQVASRNGDPYILADRDPELIYDGPIVVMVNQFSASASEILAAAIQDYNRGIIIGSDQTFGKGTVQRFIDLDRLLPYELNDLKPMGSVKMTTQKFYRINGGATQLKGVEPDIVLPDIYSLIEVGEQEHDYPMPWTEIDPVYYQRWNDQGMNILVIKQKSLTRIKKNESFQLIQDNATWLKERTDDTEYSLNYETYKKEQDQQKEISAKYDDIEKEIETLQVNFLEVDQTAMASDTTKQARWNNWKEGLQKDAYANEAISIIGDIHDSRIANK